MPGLAADKGGIAINLLRHYVMFLELGMATALKFIKLAGGFLLIHSHCQPLKYIPELNARGVCLQMPA